VLLLVNEQTPYKTLADFVADAKKRPGQIVYSSGGLYGASHLPVAMLEKAAGLPKMRHLPTSGGGPAITAMLGNNAQASTQTVLASLQHVKSGKLRALASFGAERSKALPDVPTLKELGVKVAEVDLEFWWGLFVPKGTPEPIRAKLEKALQSTMTNAAVRERLLKVDTDPSFAPGPALRVKLDNEIKNWSRFIDAKGIKVEQ